jgi:hypothetical protein
MGAPLNLANRVEKESGRPPMVSPNGQSSR